MTVLILFIAFVLVGSTPVAGQEAGQPKCHGDVLAADQGWATAATDKDLEAFLGFYDDQAVQWPASGPSLRGKDQLRALYQEVFSSPEYSVNWSVERAWVSRSCDLGNTVGHWRQTTRGDDGKVVSSKGKYLAVWHRSADGRWRVIEDFSNYATDTPGN